MRESLALGSRKDIKQILVTADDLIGKVVEVFNEYGKTIDQSEWHSNPRLKAANIFHYLYLFLYFVKRCIWRDNVNKFTHFVKRFCWKFV